MARRKKKIEEQMDIFEEGGLKDEGGTVDPVSGNDVPSGSTQSEVRDDIPAQLSEGEFVFPADVVRYIGLENLMELRQKAKMGLQKMEDMGQMGNSEEAIIDDDMQFDGEIDSFIEEMDMEETQNFAIGGMPQAGNPLTSSQVTPVATQPKTLPGFSSFVQQPAMQQVQGLQPAVESKEFIGPNGERVTIQFVNGQPATPVPDGYREMTAQEKEEAMKPKIEQPEVMQNQEDSSDDRERSEARKKEYADSLTEINTLSELSPEFKEWAEKNIPGQVKAAKAMTIDPLTGEISFPSMSFTDSLKGILSGEMYTELSAGLKELGGTGPYGKAYADIAKNVGIDINDYKKNGFLDKKNLLDAVKNTMADPNFEAKREARSDLERDRGDYEVSGLTKEQVDAQIAEDLDEIADAIDRGDYGVKSTSRSGSTVGDAGLADGSAGVTGDPAGRSMGPSYSGPAEADQVGDSYSESQQKAEEAQEDDSAGLGGYSKGGSVKPKRKKGLGRLK